MYASVPPDACNTGAETNKALTGIDQLAQAAEQIRTAQTGRLDLVIASHPSAAISRLPGLVSAFLAERPGVLVRLLSRNSDVISQLLPTESYDIGIAELPIDETAVRLSRFRMRCVATLAAGHELSARKVLTPAILSGRAVVARSRTLQTSVRELKAFTDAGADWAPIAEAEYFASVCGLVASGASWSIVDPLSAQTFKHLGLFIRDFEPAIHYEIGTFSAREREPSMLAESFLSMLTDKLNILDA